MSDIFSRTTKSSTMVRLLERGFHRRSQASIRGLTNVFLSLFSVSLSSKFKRAKHTFLGIKSSSVAAARERLTTAKESACVLKTRASTNPQSIVLSFVSQTALSFARSPTLSSTEIVSFARRLLPNWRGMD